MAVHWFVFRDDTEAFTPPTIDGCTPIAGMNIVRWDDAVADNANGSIWTACAILVSGGASGGTYKENYRIRTRDRSRGLSSSPLAVSAVIAAADAELVILPFLGATSQTPTGGITLDSTLDVAILKAVRDQDAPDNFVSAQIQAKFWQNSRAAHQGENGLGNSGAGGGWSIEPEV